VLLSMPYNSNNCCLSKLKVNGSIPHNMGGARNLKLGGSGRQGPEHRGAISFRVCGPNADVIWLLCASKRCIGVHGQSPGQEVKKPSEAETLLAFGRAMEATNLPAF